MKRLLPIVVLFFLTCSLFEENGGRRLKILYQYENLTTMSHSPENHNLFSININGNDKNNLTGGDSTYEHIIDVSVEGNKIYYRISSGDEYQIIVMNSDGTNKRVLINNVPKGLYIEKVFSDENRMLCIQSANDHHSSEIGIYNIQNSEFINLTKGGAKAHNYNVSMSMDESIIVFTSSNMEGYENDIYMIDSNGNNLTNITEDLEDSYSSQISPDGQYIIFQKHFTGSGTNGIYVFDVTSGSLKLTVPNDSCVYYIESFSDRIIPINSSEFVFAYRCWKLSDPIGIASMDGTVKKIFDLSEIDVTPRGPVISPDGDWIVFAGYDNNSGEINIYRISRNGTHLKNLTENSIDGDWFSQPYFIYE